ncbi:MAG: hypothetical protein JXA81_13530 [Sedimentisphaerales bacterium]|nr:hypothetical protein [Sedimentisphaerales bacterium]
MEEPTNAYEAAQLISKELSLPKDFAICLLREDDWSFVLKSHALIEACVIHALDARFQEHSIRDFPKDLSMAKRVDLAKQLGVLSEDMLGPIRILSSIRNNLAHDIKQVRFTFDSYLADDDNRNAFHSRFLRNASGTLEIGGKKVQRKIFLKENPKWSIIEFLIELLVEVYFHQQKAFLNTTQLGIGEMFLKYFRSSDPDLSSAGLTQLNRLKEDD